MDAQPPPGVEFVSPLTNTDLEALWRLDASQWYPALVTEAKVRAFPTHFVPLEPNVVGQLVSGEGIHVSADNSEFGAWESSDDEEKFGGPGETGPDTLAVFEPLRAPIDKIMKEFGGAAFVKLNWFSPKDATWMSFGGSLKCTSFDQIILLLKSSDACAEAVNLVSKIAALGLPGPAPQPCIVLRKWFAFNKSMEFRCFVRSNTLIAMCQKDRAFYPFLLENRLSFQDKLQQFFTTSLRPGHPRTLPAHYVFDVFVTQKGNVHLVDLGLFSEKLTDAGLFDWASLLTLEPSSFTQDHPPELRLIESTNVVPDFQSRVGGVPYDVMQVAIGATDDSGLTARDLINLMQDPGDKH